MAVLSSYLRFCFFSPTFSQQPNLSSTQHFVVLPELLESGEPDITEGSTIVAPHQRAGKVRERVQPEERCHLVPPLTAGEPNPDERIPASQKRSIIVVDDRTCGRGIQAHQCRLTQQQKDLSTGVFWNLQRCCSCVRGLLGDLALEARAALPGEMGYPEPPHSPRDADASKTRATAHAATRAVRGPPIIEAGQVGANK